MLLKEIREKFEHQLNLIQDIKELEVLRHVYAGRKSPVNSLARSIKDLSERQKRQIGKDINEIKEFILLKIKLKKNQLKEIEIEREITSQYFDLSIPAYSKKIGKIHPLEKTIEQLIIIFNSLGFTTTYGKEIETQYNNFTALNIPKDHPARQSHDTFFLKNEDLVLRTHTSNVQIHTMAHEKPPFAKFSLGKTYRKDSDSTHTPMFHQLEAFMVDKEVSFENLKYYIEKFIKLFFQNSKLKFRFRSSYFPFTSPSAEVDIMVQNKKGEHKWLEILGCGMIHNNLLKNAKIDVNVFQGFAIGIGVERLCMIKEGLNDIRLFYDDDISWVQTFGYVPSFREI